MTAPCFVDANVLVYAHNAAEPLKRDVALALLRRLWADLSGRTSVQVLNEFYSVITRKLSARMSQDDGWIEVEEYLRWNPQQLDSGLMQRARHIEARYKLSWWDSLVVAAAQQQGCSLLYTEDLQHGAIFDGVKVVNPFFAQVQEEPAPYSLKLISPHRPRGRPRKQAAIA
jgi:predicted nucleic acid-binding protein